ncbi:MAG: hypothetical protein PHV49_04660 [Alistipes sp.]|nr:hypothetical protein [Alistipes sp.]
MRILWIGLFLSLGLGACTRVTYPQTSWERDDRGMKDTALMALAQAVGGDGCVILDGKILYQWGHIARPDDWASACKPILSTLLFCAIDEGLAQSPDDRLIDHGVPLRGKDTTITFRALGAMTSGYALCEPSGVAYAYNDYAIQLYQIALFDYLFRDNAMTVTQNQFAHLQFQDPYHYSARRRIALSVEDYARLVWLWRNRGAWNGEQVVSRKYFMREMRPQVPYDLPHAAPCDPRDNLHIGSYGGGADHYTQYGPGVYGFNWWFNRRSPHTDGALLFPSLPDDLIFAMGVRGHLALFSPKRNYILVSAFGRWGEENTPWPWQRVNALLSRFIQHMEQYQ